MALFVSCTDGVAGFTWLIFNLPLNHCAVGLSIGQKFDRLHDDGFLFESCIHQNMFTSSYLFAVIVAPGGYCPATVTG